MENAQVGNGIPGSCCNCTDKLWPVVDSGGGGVHTVYVVKIGGATDVGTGPECIGGDCGVFTQNPAQKWRVV